MAETWLCPECGVPSYITRELLWLDSGVIVQSRDPGHRVVFIECENLDPLFAGIGNIIGRSIETVVIESRRRGARDYVAQFMSDETREAIRRREVDISPIIDFQMNSTLMMGFGKAELMGFRLEYDDDDLLEIKVENPFSVPLWCGTIAGACEAIVGGEWGVTCRELPQDIIEISAFRHEHSVETKGIALRKEYSYVQGDIELEKCPVCGGPAVLSRFRWQPEEGLIGSAYTDRRISINGETGLQEVFVELEKELGETIPTTVIEAQRRFVRGGFYSIEGLMSEADFRTQFAYRGLGNLSEFWMGATGLHMRLENPTLHLSVIGFAQALFELAFGVESDVDWSVSGEGDLFVDATPRAV